MHPRRVAIALLFLAGCAGPGPETPAGPDLARLAETAERMAPAAEAACRAEGTVPVCDFRVAVDTRPEVAPNAFQTLASDDRPLLIFTRALIRDARNADELAFIFAHEAAHHILGHIPMQQRAARLGAAILQREAAAGGADIAAIRLAGRVGAEIGARRFSKEMELEADALGTAITHAAGFDPVRGAEYFDRIPEPGGGFLSTHPPVAARKAVVTRVAAGLE